MGEMSDVDSVRFERRHERRRVEALQHRNVPTLSMAKATRSSSSSSAPSVTIFGSSNTDYRITGIDYLPQWGETVLVRHNATGVQRSPGGKSANTAVAARRYLKRSGSVIFITCLGDDHNGNASRQIYDDEGVDIRWCKRLPGKHSGAAILMVRPDGENAIVVLPGTNFEWSPSDFIEGSLMTEERWQVMEQANVVLMQLEVPVAMVAWVARRLAQDCVPSAGAPLVVVNVAPVPEPSASSTDALMTIVGNAHVLVVNRVECRQLVERMGGNEEALRWCEAEEWASIVHWILQRTARCFIVVITLGAMGVRAGVEWSKRDVEKLSVGDMGGARLTEPLKRDWEWIDLAPSLLVEAQHVVDTTGAGDCFCGVLVACLAEIMTAMDDDESVPPRRRGTLSMLTGDALQSALTVATTAATLSVTHDGALSSFPTRDAIHAHVSRIKGCMGSD